MSSDDYQVQSIHRYTRKTYKSRQNEQENEWNDSVNNDVVAESSHIEESAIGPRSCHCTVDHEGEITSILHKKCPVITLAQQQLQRLLDETDRILCDNTRCCRSVYDFLYVCKDLLCNQNKCQCILVFLIVMAFFTGVILGAASCGSYLGHFNSPLLTCIDNRFIPDTYTNLEDKFRSII